MPQSPPLSETWLVFTYIKVYNALLIILSLDQGAIAYALFAAYVKLIFNIGNHYRGGVVAGFISQSIGRRLTIVYVTQSSSHVSPVLTKNFQHHGPSPGR